MEECIKEARGIIRSYVTGRETLGGGKAFDDYGSVYFWTNENVDAYLNAFDYNEKSDALTVAASGDHTFNLICRGIKNIDTFDINRLTEYFAFGLKRAMILKYNYDEFINTFFLLTNTHLYTTGQFSVNDETDIIKGLLPYMEPHHKIFWQEILDYNYKTQMQMNTNKNFLIALCLGTSSCNFQNNYLTSEENYNILKAKMMDANITFTHTNALDLPDVFHKQYDFILLSNIADYFYEYLGYDWGYDKFKEYQRRMESITKTNGVIFFNYIFKHFINTGMNNQALILSSSIFQNDLTDEEILKFDEEDLGAPFGEHLTVWNGVLLKRVK